MADQEFHRAGRFPKLFFSQICPKLFFFIGFCLHFCFKMEEGFWKVGSSCICPCLTSGTLKRTLCFGVSIGPSGRGLLVPFKGAGQNFFL